MTALPQENLIYVLPQKKSRALIPKISSLLILSIIFYIGIMVNISLLDLTAVQETNIKVISLLVLGGIDFIGIYFAFHRSASYTFYQSFLAHNGKKIAYASIINTNPHTDFWDKLFKTYSVNLGNDFYLRNISQHIELQTYLQQLINYAKTQASL